MKDSHLSRNLKLVKFIVILSIILPFGWGSQDLQITMTKVNDLIQINWEEDNPSRYFIPNNVLTNQNETYLIKYTNMVICIYILEWRDKETSLSL
jgi:hypothetical protein